MFNGDMHDLPQLAMWRFVYHSNINSRKLQLEFKKPNKLLLIESLDVNFLDDIIKFMAYKRKIMVNELRERIIIISLY